jgi:hypothetical protein
MELATSPYPLCGGADARGLVHKWAYPERGVLLLRVKDWWAAKQLVLGLPSAFSLMGF